jgi:hypothetical protein
MATFTLTLTLSLSRFAGQGSAFTARSLTVA